MAVRDTAKGDAAAARIRQLSPGSVVAVHKLDLGSLASVRTAGAELAAAYPRIDLLINNAGVMYPPKQITADGFELQFGTNHLGHFALTGLLLNNMLSVDGSRVVVVSSIAHNLRAKIDFADLQWETRRYDRVASYGQSKLANLLFVQEFARRHSGGTVTAHAFHPGFVKTNFGSGADALYHNAFLFAVAFGISPEKGAETALFLAESPEGGASNGLYWYQKKPKTAPRRATVEAGRRLWDESEAVLATLLQSSR
jgi:NAD(P)-dependent dehydrogenase (short-subunit alcohol dehydrogenase family)